MDIAITHTSWKQSHQVYTNRALSNPVTNQPLLTETT